MPFRSTGDIRYYQFDLFGSDLPQAVFTRQGGISPEPWSSLNVGGTVGDDPVSVSENRRRALRALGRDAASVFDAWQVHGVNVAFADSPRLPDVPHQKADVILTDKRGITLMMRFADCVPILLYDPVRGVAGIAHAGWMGTVQGTVRAAVEAMQNKYGSKPAQIKAGIGPSIGPDHYQIGEDVIRQVRLAFGQHADQLLIKRNNLDFLDLWRANTLILQYAGVEQIEVSEICTGCHIEDWFSHRLEKGRTGRFGAIIALND